MILVVVKFGILKHEYTVVQYYFIITTSGCLTEVLYTLNQSIRATVAVSDVSSTISSSIGSSSSIVGSSLSWLTFLP